MMATKQGRYAPIGLSPCEKDGGCKNFDKCANPATAPKSRIMGHSPYYEIGCDAFINWIMGGRRK
jgi:hypothetical protein